MNKKIASLLVIGGMLLGAAGSVSLAVYAQSIPTQPTITPAASGQALGAGDFKDGEIADQNEANAEAEQQDARAEQSSLQTKAKITADQAKQVSEAKLGGIATSVRLGDENGSIVYEVVVGSQEVKVSAIDGSILKIEQSGKEYKHGETLAQDKETIDDNNQADMETNDGGLSQ